MLDCLIDYIGLQSCVGAYETSESGQYLNTLPGITIKSMDKISESEQQSFQNVWSDVQIEAANRFYDDVIFQLNQCFSLNPYCDYEELICENKERLTRAWKYLLGNQLMITRIHSERFNRYTTVGKEQAEELKDLYQVEYEAALKQAVQFIDVTSCELCCGGNPEYVTYLP